MGEEEQNDGFVVETPAPEEQEVSLEEKAPEEKAMPLDPGQNEGKRDQSKVPPERFEEVYGKMKGYERRIAEYTEKMSAKDAVLEEARKHNQALMDKLEKLSNKAIDAVEQSSERQAAEPQGEPAGVLAARRAMAELEEKKEVALDKLDSKEVVRIDKELRKVERYLEGYEAFVADQKAKRQAAPKQRRQAQEPDVDPDITKFIETTPWYGKDPLMTGAAKEYDLHLSKQDEWKDKPLSKRLAKVKEDIEAKFGGNGNQAPARPTKPAGVESGLGLNRPAATQRTVKLNEAQLAVARGLGVTPEEYAKQLSFLGGAV